MENVGNKNNPDRIQREQIKMNALTGDLATNEGG